MNADIRADRERRNRTADSTDDMKCRPDAGEGSRKRGGQPQMNTDARADKEPLRNPTSGLGQTGIQRPETRTRKLMKDEGTMDG